jgi:lycopene beta-cyclase
MATNDYDYIILGAGAAGMSLAVRLIDHGLLNQKKLLIIDKDDKKTNDRTWCFWEKNIGYFESLVHHRWDNLIFSDTQGSIPLNLAGYQYKMIRGIDFYNHVKEKIKVDPNIHWLKGTIEKINVSNKSAIIELDNGTISSNTAVVFNTLYTPPSFTEAPLQLLQHFKGWIIETESPHFDPNKAHFMDFSISQEHGTTFVYTLPIATNKALIEYTLFTEELLPADTYDQALRSYIEEQLQILDYKITETEFGIIPMNNKRYPFYAEGMYHLGTAGGQTKASTGYTFQNIQERCDAIISHLKRGLSLQDIPEKSTKFHFYDTILLHLLQKGVPSGHDIFSRLFRKNKAAVLFKFLDEKTSIWEEIGIFKTLQVKEFMKAALNVQR